MNKPKFIVCTFLICALLLVLVGPSRVCAQVGKTPYPTMAALDQYLMTDRNAEIALARTAAPETISRDATVMVLGRHGYETAVEGKNGFVCIVERAWMAQFGSAEFWNPKNRSPLCLNPPAARSILPITIKRTEMILAGKSTAEIIAAFRQAYAKKELPDVEPGAMTYMMSKQAYLTDRGDHNVAHLMFYTPLMDGAVWGADVPNSPVILLSQFRGAPEPVDVFIVLTGMWSDGTPAPLM